MNSQSVIDDTMPEATTANAMRVQGIPLKRTLAQDGIQSSVGKFPVTTAESVSTSVDSGNVTSPACGEASAFWKLTE
jgi:hypothetical protein